MGLRLILDIGEGMGTIQVDDKRASRVSLLHYLELERIQAEILNERWSPLYKGRELTADEKELAKRSLQCLYTTHKATIKELERLLEDD